MDSSDSDMGVEISPNIRYPSILYVQNRSASVRGADESDQKQASIEKNEDSDEEVEPATKVVPVQLDGSATKLNEKKIPTQNDAELVMKRKHNKELKQKRKVKRKKKEVEKGGRIMREKEQIKLRNQLHHKYKLTSWINWKEWSLMKELLSANEFESATKLLRIFEIRRKNNIPITIVISVLLVKILNETDKNKEEEKRLSLALIIIRFINGLTDTFELKDVYKNKAESLPPVSIRAKKLNLPPMLVELRHQATHGHLPSLSLLTYAAKQALLWLDINYWQPQFNCLTSLNLLPIRQPTKDQVTHLESIFDTNPQPADTSNIMHQKSPTSVGDSGERMISLLNQCIEDLQQVDKNIIESYNEPGVSSKSEKNKKKTDTPTNAGYSPTKNTSSHSGIWEECGDEHLWSNLPLGLIPGQNEPPCMTRNDLLDDGDEQSHINDLNQDEKEHEDDDNDEIEPGSEEETNLQPRFSEDQEEQIKEELSRLKAVLTTGMI